MPQWNNELSCGTMNMMGYTDEMAGPSPYMLDAHLMNLHRRQALPLAPMDWSANREYIEMMDNNNSIYILLFKYINNCSLYAASMHR